MKTILFFMFLFLFSNVSLCESFLSFNIKKAKSGNTESQYFLGLYYYYGSLKTFNKSIPDIPIDKAKGIYWLSLAAENNDLDAMNSLGLIYMSQGKDEEIKAFLLFKKSAEEGNTQAYLNLGICYNAGIGTLIDKTKAAYWVKKAYENGDNEAINIWNKYNLWKYE